jgi:hypothetical protein
MFRGEKKHHKKPDVDNLQKYVLDCMNEAIIHDDAQIYSILAEKEYSDTPCTIIRLFTDEYDEDEFYAEMERVVEFEELLLGREEEYDESI